MYVGVDLGAGFGAKIGLFDSEMNRESSIAVGISGVDSCDRLVEKLAGAVQDMVELHESEIKKVNSIGLVSPGIFTRSGSYIVASNLPFLKGENLRQGLEERIGVPVGIENDANAGGLAEWSIRREELLYWVLGGGFGGAWVNAAGDVMNPALDWDGKDSTLHPTNEPGYATPLMKKDVRMMFGDSGVDYDYFVRILEEDVEALGPDGRDDALRAEMLVSGTGRLRIFRTVVKDSGMYNHIFSSSKAGAYLDQLHYGAFRHDMEVTDALFGKLFALAGIQVIDAAIRDGADPHIPIYIAGKPAKAFKFFRQALVNGLEPATNPIAVSKIEEKEGNANLLGAAVLAKKVYENEQRRVKEFV